MQFKFFLQLQASISLLAIKYNADLRYFNATFNVRGGKHVCLLHAVYDMYSFAIIFLLSGVVK